MQYLIKWKGYPDSENQWVDKDDVFADKALQELVNGCQEAALTRRTAWRRGRGGVGLGPSGKQLYPATPELTAWQEGPADSSQ